MVTKQTGRPPGRPKKAKGQEVDQTPQRDRGRPAYRISEDPDRRFIGFCQATTERQKRTMGDDSPGMNKLVEGLVVMRYGLIDASKENLDALKRGDRPVRIVVPKESGLRQREKVEFPEYWRDKNEARMEADGIMGKLRRIRNERPDAPNRVWLATFVKIWIVCLQGDRSLALSAARWAETIGETAYFKAAMRPILIVHAALRDKGAAKATIPLELLMLLLKTASEELEPVKL
jgi:hypothetical protein